MIRYVLDANVYIQASLEYYSFTTNPGFWDGLDRLFKNKRAISIKAVITELTRHENELSDWIKTRSKESWIKDHSEIDVQKAYKKVLDHVNRHPQYFQSAKDQFFKGADPWLIAYAMVKKMVIVTQEVEKPDVKKSVPIPNICKDLDVPFINTFELLEETETKFCLKIEEEDTENIF